MSRDMQMQKETGKNLYRKCLSENLGLVLLAPIFLGIQFAVSILYQLDPEYVFYITSIFLIFWGIAVCAISNALQKGQTTGKRAGRSTGQ